METSEGALALLCSAQVGHAGGSSVDLHAGGGRASSQWLLLDLTQVLIKPNEAPMDRLLLSTFLPAEDLEAGRNEAIRLRSTDKFRRKLEELEKEKNSLKFQLPSRHPSISSFLDRFVTQVQAALRWAADHQVRHEETHPWHENEHKLLRSTYQERIQISSTKRNQLFQEKKWLQKEIEDLRARLAILEAKDQQLRREIEEQDRLIQSQDCELTALLGCISLRELQEISKAVDDTLASSYQIPFSLDLPGTIK
ncbi:PREDICTED: disrupted in schizophrenia 1 protein-like, partial [Tauraco erythrolophus]|uniref:disrupted in schizophrenia 1 protein-like n=1 Tax=Tauraco erythrolophus TaxID=121530 RepID=UPI000523C901